MAEEGLSNSTTNFSVLQETYRTKLQTFFSDSHNYQRLKKLLDEGERACSVIFFFVKEYKKGALVTTDDGTVCCLLDEYKTALTNFKKRFYDFQSVVGKGELIYNGERNPAVTVCEAQGDVSAPLPCLMALHWFIQRGFDHLFWREQEKVEEAYEEFTASVKQRYAKAHKERKARAELQLKERKKNMKATSDELETQMVADLLADLVSEVLAGFDVDDGMRPKKKRRRRKGPEQEEISRIVRDLRRTEGAPRLPKNEPRAVILHSTNFIVSGEDDSNKNITN